VVWRVGPHACSIACGTGRDPERHESVVQRSPHESRDWCGGRGTGAVKATGSYEGSLSAEGTSGRHEPSPFTSGWSRRPRRLPHASTGDGRGSKGPRSKVSRRRFPDSGGRGRGDRSVRGTIADSYRGKNTPTLDTPETSQEIEGPPGTWQCVTTSDPPKRQRRRETPLSPVGSAGPKTLQDIHAAKVAAVSREHTRYG